jgi:hypothetical protein
MSAVEQTAASPHQSTLILEGVDRYRVMEPMFEGVRIALAYRGDAYNPAYIQGISGAAFRVAGICPCAPTCSTAMQPQDLARLLGYQVEHLPLEGEGDQRDARLRHVLSRVKNEVRAGRPVVLWHAFTNAEWDVVCGFDEAQGLFFGRGSYAGLEAYASADDARAIRCLDICPALGAILIGEKTSAFDARAAEVAALREAVRHAHAEQPASPDGRWAFLEGLQSYSRWVADFSSGPARKRGAGDAYCLNVYRSTHRAAAAFLREIAPRYAEARGRLSQAAQHFAVEADTLDACAPLLGWESPEGPDRERNARAAALLGEARDAYARGCDQICLALSALEMPA